MKPIQFITGNPGKFREIQGFIPQVVQTDIDLPEVQSLDPQVVIQEKLLEAKRQLADGEFMVEDTSLYLDGLNGFPGPLVKWMLESVGNDGIYKLTQKIHNNKAWVKAVIGYVDPAGEIHYFEGELTGRIVAPVGEVGQGFGWDSIFQPDGLNETFAEMGDDLKQEFSHRSLAAKKFKAFLQDQGRLA